MAGDPVGVRSEHRPRPYAQHLPLPFFPRPLGHRLWDNNRAVLVRQGGARDRLLQSPEYLLFTAGNGLDTYQDADTLRGLIAEM